MTITYPEVDLDYNPATGQYEKLLTNLNISGIYRIVAFARDASNELSDPYVAQITVQGALPGDVDGDGSVTLADAVLALKIVNGQDTSGYTVKAGADVNGDGRIGLPEMIYILQKVGDLR